LDGLLIATGHFRSGILLAPITAQMIREWITTQNVSVDWARFSPVRFGPMQVGDIARTTNS
jgi:glycine oxidase